VLARHVIEAMETLAERKGSDLRLVEPGVACVAEVDSRRIERVLRNLVANAIEHGEGRPIEVRVAATTTRSRSRSGTTVSGSSPRPSAWSSTGSGGADPARARTTGGTGLGLSIALEDAHLHDGWLQAWGEPGDGCQFRLTLARRLGAGLERSPIPLEPLDSSRRLRPLTVGQPYRQVRTPGSVDV
jgi:two-component system sensor histidine kinase MtrB